MAQAGFTPIQLYFSSTTTNAPLAANLANGELAINITDGKLFYKDNASAVQVIAWKVTPATAGGTGQTSYAVGDLLYADTTTTLAKLPDVATGNALISGGVGVAPSWGKIGLTTHVSGILPLANGGTNANISATNGGVIYSTASALAVTAAGTANQILISNGAAAPSWSTGIQSANLPVGSVLQVVNATYATQTLSTTSAYADTGLTASITPKFSTSKILVLVNQNGLSKKGTSSAFNALNMQLLRGATVLAQIASGYGYTGLLVENASGQCSTSYLDSPATTSSTTYKTQFAADQNVDGVIVQNGSSVSTITLLEIAA